MGWLRLLCTVLGLVFLVAGLTKLFPPDHRLLFEMAVSAHRMLPPEAVIWAGWLIPLGEIALGLLLVAGWRTRATSGLATCVLGIFVGVMTAAYFRGIQADCGCFGFGEPISRFTLVRDGVLLGLALTITLMAWRQARPNPATARRGTP